LMRSAGRYRAARSIAAASEIPSRPSRTEDVVSVIT
jgi:hypothetical protein